MNGDLRLVGVGGSPYTRKLRAALRFRRIPYQFVIMGSIAGLVGDKILDRSSRLVVTRL